MRRHELSDAQWERIRDLFPTGPRPGRPWKDHRAMLDAMLWILLTGAPWRDLPERYGPWQSVYDRFVRYRRDGTFQRILERLQLELDHQGLIDPDTWFCDATIVRASRAAAGARKGGIQRSRKITPWAARAEAFRASSTSSASATVSRSRRR
jgi:transposase